MALVAAWTGALRARRTGRGAAGDSSPSALLPWLWTGALALSLQLLLIKVIGPDTIRPPFWGWTVFASHLLLLPFLLRNIRYMGLKIVFVGLLINLLVMGVNGGLMPVDASGLEAAGPSGLSLSAGDPIPGSKDVLSENPRFIQLSDSLTLPLPGGLTHVFSAGDLIVGAGTICALVSVSRGLLARADSRSAEVSRRVS